MDTAGGQEAKRSPACIYCKKVDPVSVRMCQLSGVKLQVPVCRDCFATLDPSLTEPQIHTPGVNERDMRLETIRLAALDRLGTDDPLCRLCGQEDDPDCLELHHIAGKDFGKTTVIHCCNCHRKVSKLQRLHPPRFGKAPADEERIGRHLLGLADDFVMLAIKLKEHGEYLIERARSLTVNPEGGKP